MKKSVQLVLLIAMVLIALFSCVICFVLFGPTAKTVENINAVEWLPDEACDISYHLNISFQYIEFSIPPSQASAYAKSKQWDVVSFSNTPTEAICYAQFKNIHPSQKNDYENAVLESGQEIKSYRHTVTNGWCYDSLNKSGGVLAVYDLENERLCVFYSMH